MATTITLNNIGKKFDKEWIFKNLSFQFSTNHIYAITGHNGSGKSTLLQSIAGFLFCNKGQIVFEKEGQKIEPENVQQHISLSAPYLELIEEMTANEFLQFHHTLKPFFSYLNFAQILDCVGLSKAANKQIRNFSSGMKQRLKLAQAFCSNTAVLLLDEPTANLDADGVAIYHNLLQQYKQNRIVIICSNDPKEYNLCTAEINIENYK